MRGCLRLLVAAIVVSPALAWSQGIRNTRHDLSFSSATGGPRALSVNQICIFCHTPHRAATTRPLWNHRQTGATSWSWGNDLDGNPLTRTTAGTTLPSTLRSPSKRCLGCHDGSIALGDVLNAGSGEPGVIEVDDVMGRIVGNGANMGTNHPVSVPYAGQLGYNGIDSAVPAGDVNNGTGNWWRVTTTNCQGTYGICTEANGSPLDGTRINLVPMNRENPGATGVGVECVTCHEPHNKYGFSRFLRLPQNNTSALCRSCHNK